jgi:hypothetical protein
MYERVDNMTKKEYLQKRIAEYKKELVIMNERNDGSLRWVDEIRELIMLIDTLEQSKSN